MGEELGEISARYFLYIWEDGSQNDDAASRDTAVSSVTAEMSICNILQHNSSRDLPQSKNHGGHYLSKITTPVTLWRVLSITEFTHGIEPPRQAAAFGFAPHPTTLPDGKIQSTVYIKTSSRCQETGFFRVTFKGEGVSFPGWKNFETKPEQWQADDTKAKRMLGQTTWRWQPSYWPVFGPLLCQLGGSPHWQERALYLVRQAAQLFLQQQPTAV